MVVDRLARKAVQPVRAMARHPRAEEALHKALAVRDKSAAKEVLTDPLQTDSMTAMTALKIAATTAVRVAMSYPATSTHS